MKGFRGIRQPGKNRVHEQSGEHRTAEDKNNMSMSNFSVNKKRVLASRKWIITAACGVIIAASIGFAGKQYVAANTVPYYKVMVKGNEIGSITDEAQLQKLFADKTEEYQNKYPEAEMVLNTDGITTETVKAYKPEVNSEETLDKLDDMLTAYAKGVELKVDGEVIGIVKDQATADAILEQVQNKYISASAVRSSLKTKSVSANSSSKAEGPSTTLKSVDIKEDVATEAVKADPNKIWDVSEAVKALTVGKDAPVTYVVREGDTISSIAAKYEITQSEIRANNPGIKETSLQIGDELTLTVPKPAVTVKSVEQVVEQIEIKPQVEVRKSAELKAGTTKVVRPGQSGLKSMQYRVTKENGEVIKEEWLGQEVIKAAVTEVVLSGTKVVGEGTGEFAWPVSNATMSSSFGQRWGRQHKGVDLVGNRDVKSADEGVVTFAGQKSGYGNVIIINHRNGYETLYGHLDSIGVKVGQVVEKGESIGVMGNTGRSTGTHLHFEIIKNGTPENPMTYLN
ncbi:peptidoglycan DD-metalloendopeptidase family protein [Paenibacillus xylanilyticus]|uniref:Peptidoglycan DD-metalloendopeptidase family protein n=1 Tax=Paenibacillus xylanilyticus TaxID=248903 RepID=A0A7Y6C079_9BACL|nr:peptidoglycan DD-metalloendopeptidase family protein [Paenibacillus xylanilyticus]NUU77405.1 peptidoglycan DD-metalloendopeptidase family protein [Paenibacillus xylanilyticus]